MRVLNVIHYPVFGGQHNEVLRSAALMAERGWESVTLVPDEPGSGAWRLRSAGLDVIQAPLHRLRATYDPRLHFGLALKFLPETQHIRDLIRALGIDLVRVIGLTNPHSAVAARLEGKPVVWQIVDTRPPPAVRYACTAIALRLANVLLFTGHTLAELHGGPERFTQPWFSYIPPVDTAVFRPDPEQGDQTRRSLGIPLDARVIGTVSNLNPQKGLEYLIRAAGRVSPKLPNLWVLVVGASYPSHRAFLTRLNDEIARGPLSAERVVFTDGVSDPQLYYPAMDVKVVTSPPRSEGIPTTGLEALSCGVPVVATNVGAVTEVVHDGLTGLVVPPLDESAIASAILRLLIDEEQRRAMSKAARSTAVACFSQQKYVDILEQAFRAATRTPDAAAGNDTVSRARS